MAAKIDTDDLLTCPICFEQLTSPKNLPCFHTFCQPCLKSYIITHLGGEGKRGQTFPCPVCRQVVNITDKTLTPEKIADSLPDNDLIASLTKRSPGSENEKLCGPCSRESKESAATHWCKYCLEFLCENCTASHKRLDQSRHKLFAVCDMGEVTSKELLDVDEPCSRHTGENLKVYCVDHKEMCCVICLATSHRKCEHISTFDEMVSDSKETEIYEHFDNKLNEIDKKSDKLRIKTEENLSNLDKSQEEIRENVSNTIQKAKDKLDKLQTKFEHSLQQKHKEESTKLSERKDRIEIFQNNVKKGQKLEQAVREHGSPKQQFITREKIKQQIKEHAKNLGEDLKDVKCVAYALKLDDTVKSVAQNVDAIAEVEVKLASDLSKNLRDILDVTNKLDGEELKNDKDAVSTKPFDIMKLDVQLLGSTVQKGHLAGGTYLPDGRIVFCNWNTKTLCVCDKVEKSLFEPLDLDHRPIDACCIVNSEEIIVSFDNQSYVRKYKVTQKNFKEKATIHCKPEPWGLAATKDTIVVGYWDRIDILALDGTYKQTLTTRNGYKQSYVTTSPVGHVYYIDGDSVVCKGLDGREISRFVHPELKRLYGIAVDKFGNVYVLGYQSRNVCIFSADGLHKKILLKDLQEPYQIKFNPEGSEFFITVNKKGQIYTSELFICK